MHETIIIIAKYFIGLSALVALAVWLKLSLAQKKRFVLVSIAGGGLSLGLAKIGAKLYYDTRPFVTSHLTPYFSHAADNGFPSDHTLLASFLGFIVWRYNRRAGSLLLGLAVLIGLSRVIAGVHHLSDIVGSFIFAFIGAWLANGLIRYLIKTRRPVTNIDKAGPTA